MTFGVVLTSPFANRWLDRLQLSLDWYRIEIDDAIVTVFADEFISRCFDRTFNPEFEASNQWCGMFSRDPTTGDIVDAYQILRNSEGLRTSGLDLQLDWRFDLGPGELGVNWLVAYLDSRSDGRYWIDELPVIVDSRLGVDHKYVISHSGGGNFWD